MTRRPRLKQTTRSVTDETTSHRVNSPIRNPDIASLRVLAFIQLDLSTKARVETRGRARRQTLYSRNGKRTKAVYPHQHPTRKIQPTKHGTFYRRSSSHPHQAISQKRGSAGALHRRANVALVLCLERLLVLKFLVGHRGLRGGWWQRAWCNGTAHVQQRNHHDVGYVGSMDCGGRGVVTSCKEL